MCDFGSFLRRLHNGGHGLLRRVLITETKVLRITRMRSLKQSRKDIIEVMELYLNDIVAKKSMFSIKFLGPSLY